jgi:transposase
MPYRIAGVDVHKKMLAVVVTDVDVEGEWRVERRQFGTSPSQLRAVATWFRERDVEEVVMESTAQYWRPVWDTLERDWQRIRRARVDAGATAGARHLAQAQSNHGPRGRKQDFPDAERVVKRLVAHELTLSVVPERTQRLWRTVTRRTYQVTCNRVQLRNRLECLLEEMPIKISSLVADLLGLSGRRMLRAVAAGDTDPATIAALGSPRLHATPDQLCDALGPCTDRDPVYRRLLSMILDELDLIEAQVGHLDEELARLLRVHQDAVERLAAVPGLGVDSAQQIIAEVGPTAATFASAKRLASWVGACPGHDESAGINHSHRSPNGNRQMRRLLNQAANAAVKTKGSIFELVYRRLVVRLGHAQAIGAMAHRLCRLVWKLLHDGVVYEERGPAVTKARAQRRAAKMIRELRSLGYRVEPKLATASTLA